MSHKRKKDSRVVVSEEIKVRRFTLPKFTKGETKSINNEAVKAAPRHKTRTTGLIVGVIVVVLVILGVGYTYQHGRHKTSKTTSVSQQDKQYQTYVNSPNYKNAGEQQKINFRTEAATQYVSLSAYQKALDELAKIQKDFPEGAPKNINFLMYSFIAYYSLKDQAKTSEYARKVKALSPTLPAEYQVWQSLVDKNAQQ